MKTSTLLLLSFLGLGAAVIATGCGPSDNDDDVCSASTCPDGCCDAAGVCQAGLVSEACGTGGAACQTCSGAQSCQGGLCTVPNNNNGGDMAQWCTQYTTSACDMAVRCGEMSSTASCLEINAPLYDLLCKGIIAAAVKDGRVEVDMANSTACFAFISNDWSCDADDDQAPDDPACANLLVGKVPAGGDCYNDVECAPGHYCEGAGLQSCPGVCTPRAGVGESATDSDCEDGLYVYYGDDTCQVPVAAGESCAPLGGTFYDQECVHGYYCDDASKLCVENKGEGEACAVDQCRSSLQCIAGTCQTLGNVGDPCTGSSCMQDLLCNAGTCAERGAEGAACSSSSQCKPSLVCAGGECTTPAAVGEACADSTFCNSESWCDAGTCQPQKAEGETCTDHEECMGGCDEGFCGQVYGFCIDPTP